MFSHWALNSPVDIYRATCIADVQPGLNEQRRPAQS